MDIGVSKVLLN